MSSATYFNEPAKHGEGPVSKEERFAVGELHPGTPFVVRRRKKVKQQQRDITRMWFKHDE